MNENAKIARRVIARCWTDETYKRKLLANPNPVLIAEGLAIPNGVRAKVVENTDTTWCFVVPQRPADPTEMQLSAMAAGATDGIHEGADWPTPR